MYVSSLHVYIYMYVCFLYIHICLFRRVRNSLSVADVASHYNVYICICIHIHIHTHKCIYLHISGPIVPPYDPAIG